LEWSTQSHFPDTRNPNIVYLRNRRLCNLSAEGALGLDTVLAGGAIRGEKVVTEGQLRLMPGVKVVVRDAS